jgi:hypothetical protein
MKTIIAIIISLLSLVSAGTGDNHSGDDCQPFVPADNSVDQWTSALMKNPCYKDAGFFCSPQENKCRHCTDGDIPLPHFGCFADDMSPDQWKQTQELYDGQIPDKYAYRAQKWW